MQHGLNLATAICEECSFVFTNPIPPREVYERFYVEAYSQYYGHITPKPVGTSTCEEAPQLSLKFALLEKWLTLTGSRLLEIGPGHGLFLYWAQQRGCQVLGVEPSPEFCRVLAASNLPHVQGALSDVHPEKYGQFDIIFMAHVLEHFYEPNEAIQHCRRLLKRNGLLVLEVPNILKPFRSLDRYFLRYVHPSNFSPTTLRAMLEKHGFQVVHLDEGGQDWRSPQNLSAVARFDQGATTRPISMDGEAEKVFQKLLSYRRTWTRVVAPQWYARSLVRQARKNIIKVARPFKYLLVGNQRVI